ncbi:MAG: hypothetical protein AB7F51_06400, partial [Pseudorhodoplanes sp.]
GEISRAVNFEPTVAVLLAIGEGIEVRRVSDPSFDVETVMPSILDIVKHMLVEPVGARNPAGELV